jgi:hypothetical protein
MTEPPPKPLDYATPKPQGKRLYIAIHFWAVLVWLVIWLLMVSVLARG